MKFLKTLLLFSCFIGSLSGWAAANADETIYFTGKSFQDKRDGIQFIRPEPPEGDEFFTISSSHFHYFLVLPYSDEWRFTLDDTSLLRGTCGAFNVTLLARESDETPEQVLKQHKSYILSNPKTKGIKEIEIIKHGGISVLRNTVDLEALSGLEKYRGFEIRHFFVARKWKRELFLLHLSKTVSPGEAFLEDKHLFMLTKGFDVDFMREGEQ
ncbi:MAG: hypothetical protein V5B60_07060 [Accumulibacter sp.]|jgi:hypothetical protein|uniref:hypothetical protein n=1 Tax=Accumulibacter sp. TaxID=2053492 RepID=UPI002FC2F9C8